MNEIEKSFVLVAQKILDLYKEKLLQIDVKFAGPEIEVWKQEAAQRTSEIRVKFYRMNKLEDIFEFHIFREGKQVVNESELEDWFHKNLKIMLS